MGIYRLSNRVVSGIRNVDCRMRLLSSAPGAVACAVLSAKKPRRQKSAEDSGHYNRPTLIRRCRWVLVFMSDG